MSADKGIKLETFFQMKLEHVKPHKVQSLLIGKNPIQIRMYIWELVLLTLLGLKDPSTGEPTQFKYMYSYLKISGLLPQYTPLQVCQNLQLFVLLLEHFQSKV